MGRFDALLQPTKPQVTIEESVEEKARKTAKPQDGKPVSPKTVLPSSQQDHLPASPQVNKPAKPFAGKPVNPLDRKPEKEEVEKYTTRLTPSMVKRIKIYAAQQDLNDYDVVAKALIEYFERNK